MEKQTNVDVCVDIKDVKTNSCENVWSTGFMRGIEGALYILEHSKSIEDAVMKVKLEKKKIEAYLERGDNSQRKTWE